MDMQSSRCRTRIRLIPTVKVTADQFDVKRAAQREAHERDHADSR